ncbi:MAG: aminotransferase class I/II-fold pyridoxal phosphate-dependent enzyme [Gemmatimonadaceae bacterium]|jgi:histidinol-phosphate aminotransferase|nr:aminotransferase class I/II-fold pyridoxal phosphate-dependent enzyme [Gemmatimonadaceae bacterium]
MTATGTTDRLAVAREAYASLGLYDPKRAPVDLDLTDNTNLWGVPPTAERTLRELAVSAMTRYPSLYAADLKGALADYVGVAPEMVVTGCGSDDILDSAMRAFGEPGELVVSSDPSFAMIPIFAQMNALRWQGVVERADQQPDVEALLALQPKVLYLCTPNNPTGAVVPRATIERVLTESTGVVMIDEAYAEFAGSSVIDLTARHDRLLVVRTLSKAFGLAGLRLGYAVGAPRLVAEVEKSRGPYKASAVAERVGAVALREDREWVEAHVALAIEVRERLASRLVTAGFRPLPSAANFVCVPVAQCVAVGQAMRARGVAVRPFPALPHVGDTLRMSVGPWPLVERMLGVFLEANREVNG